MSLIVTTENTEQEASLMASPEIKYVSLVQHAANREPFRVIKQDTTGGESIMAGSVVQRIIAPAGTDVIAVLNEEGIEFDGNVSVEVKAEHEGFDVYTQQDIKKFDAEAFDVRVLTKKSDIMAVYGVLKNEDDIQPEETVEKSDTVSDLAETIVDVQVENSYYGMYVSTTTALDSLDNELWNFNRAMYSIGNAAGLDGKSRLKSMIALIDGLKTFVTSLMAFVKDSSDTVTKSEDGTETPSGDICHTAKFEKLNAMISATKEIMLKNEGINMEPEKLTELVTKAVAEAMTVVQKSEADATVTELSQKMEALTAEVTALKTEKEETVVKADTLTKEVEALKAEKETLEKKVADLEALPETSSVSKADVFKDTVVSVKKNDKLSCFDDLFAPRT